MSPARGRIRERRPPRSAAVLALAGCIVLGHGLWIPAKAALAQQLLEASWRNTAPGGTPVRPWPWADTWPVARIRFPRLERSHIVLAGATGRTLAFGPGHTSGSAPPGRPGTSIVSGHRDTHFRLLQQLQRGDSVEVERSDGTTVSYRVDDLQVVDSRSTRLQASDELDALVLVTCWPFDAPLPGGPLRYVVTALRSEAGPQPRRF